MKNFKSLLPFLLMLFVWAGCDTDDLRNDVDELKNRVESLEAQVSAINDNMNVLKVLTDGKQTIQSCVYDEASNSYKLVLSDNTELTLTQGKQGTVNYPQITISQNGTWVINGEDSGKEAVGDNAPTPKFAIDANGYWTVDFGNGATQVLGADGQPVLATTSGSVTVTDEFFKDVDVVNGELVVTLQNDEVYSLPIVEALVCDIQTENVNEFKNGVLTVGYGEEVSLNVVVKGDNAFVSAPAGWTAVLGEPDAQTNIAVLTIKAPAESAASTTLGRAATADNTKDLTVQVNKGVAWAVDKIQVEATKVISSYKALYDAGETININGIEIKESVYGEALLISNSDFQITSENIPPSGVIFIKDGINVTFDYATKTNLEKLILIGDNPQKKSSLKMNRQIRMTPGDANNGMFVCYNMDLDATSVSDAEGSPSYLLSIQANGALKDVVFYNSFITLSTIQQPLAYLGNNGRYITNFTIEKCKFDYPGGTTNQRYLLSVSSSTATYANIVLKNNIFYSREGIEQKFKLFNGTQATIVNLILENNTFVNLASETTAYVYAKMVEHIKANKNIFFANVGNINNYYIIFRLTTAATGDTTDDNVGYRSDDTTNGWRMFYVSSGISSGWDGAPDVKKIDDNPFDGGTFDLSTGTFVPNATYAEYGAKFE